MTIRVAACAAACVLALAAISARADGIDVITLRQTAYDLQAGSFGYIRTVVAAKGEVKPLEAPAKAIARWASVMPSLFPPGSDKGGNTKALPEIWSDSAGFQKAAANLGEHATKLASAAAANDAETVATETKALGDACGACHKAYRAK